ncbi:MAG: glucose-6-phosphate isomerase, partial [Dehalococcoidia bacterium]
RLFVHLRSQEDDNGDTDALIEQLGAAGHPVVRLDLKDRYDLGAEFFRWEFATAVAGAVLDIHPFDQPNVQGAKDQTDAVLAQYQSSGSLPEMESTSTLPELLRQLKAGDYLAIMAYLPETPEFLAAIESLRQRVMERYGVATTFGFGPRFLHSTGQLHKGGPDSGVFLQLTADHPQDITTPGKPFTFQVLADAQALGDLQALQNLGRRAARIHLGVEPAAGVQHLTQEIG